MTSPALPLAGSELGSGSGAGANDDKCSVEGCGAGGGVLTVNHTYTKHHQIARWTKLYITIGGFLSLDIARK